jgi:hypothetical protein
MADALQNHIEKALRTEQALRSGVVWINDTQPAPSVDLDLS